MRSAALLSLLFVVSGYAANAQFTFLPQAGLENPLTRLSYNELSSFTPLQQQVSVNMGMRLEYKIKKIGQGPYLNVSTSRLSVAYNFTNPETGMSNFTADAGNMQLRFEGGWQLGTKPIYFKNKSASSSKQESKAKPQAVTAQQYKSKSGCQSYAKTHCGDKKKTETARKQPTKGTFIRFVPSVGLAYLPSAEQAILTKGDGVQTSYAYNAGSVRTAFIAGTGIEIGKGTHSSVRLTVSYIKGLGDTKSSITTLQGNKAINTTLDSKVSGWSATLGIPVSLAKKTKQHKPQQKTKTYDCQKYKIQYKSGCRKSI